MEHTLVELGLGGGLAIMIIREVFNFLKHRNGNGKGTPELILAELKEINKHLFPLPAAIERIEGRQHKHEATLTTVHNKLDIAMERQTQMKSDLAKLKP